MDCVAQLVCVIFVLCFDVEPFLFLLVFAVGHNQASHHLNNCVKGRFLDGYSDTSGRVSWKMVLRVRTRVPIDDPW